MRGLEGIGQVNCWPELCSHSRLPNLLGHSVPIQDMVNSPDLIMKEQVGFYSNLYCSKQKCSTDSLQVFVQGRELPFLSHSQRHLLHYTITVEELQLVASSFPNFKSPGDDGLPAKVYKQYKEVILPHLI